VVIIQTYFIALALLLLDNLWGGLTLDALSGATPLDTMKMALNQFHTIEEIKDNPLFGHLWSEGMGMDRRGILLGGCWLIYNE